MSYRITDSPASSRPPEVNVRKAASIVPQTLATLTVLALLAMLTIGARQLNGAVAPQDEGVLLVYADLILRGYVPYRDFAVLYGPANLYIIASAFALFGKSVLVERAVDLCFRYLIVAMCFLLGQRISWSVGLLSALASLTAAIFFPFYGAYAIFGALAVAMTALYTGYIASESTEMKAQYRWTVLSGGLSACIFWFRPEIGVIGTLAVLALMAPRDLWRLTPFAQGFALPCCVGVAFVLAVGPSHVFDSLVLDPLRVAPGRVLPLWPTPHVIALVVGAAIAGGIGVGLTRRSFPGPQVGLARGIAVLALGLLPLALQRADIWHTTYVGTVIMGLAVISSGILAARFIRLELPLTAGITLCVLSAAAAFAANASARRMVSWTSAEIRSNERSLFTCFWPGGATPADLQHMLNEVNRVSRAGQTLFVGPSDLRFAMYNDTFLYYLLPQLEPVSRYLEMNPGVPNRLNSGLDKHIAGADWLILTSQYGGWKEPNESTTPGSSRPNEVVGQLFCTHAEFGAWKILRRCHR